MGLFRYKRIRLVLLVPASLGLLALARAFPAGTERFYTRGLYRLFSSVIGRLISIFPFSLTGVALTAILPCFALWGVVSLRKRRNGPVRIAPRSKAALWHRFAATLLAAASCIYFLFALFCAPNYHRLTFAQQSGLEVRPSSAEELEALCLHLAGEANRLREELPMDEAGVMRLEMTHRQLARQAQRLYPLAGSDYPALGGYVTRPKAFTFSRGMSWLNITGIYIPWLFEPNINADAVDYTIPATMMHEMSHFKGYMREEEANFLAYLTCRYSGDAVFAYSGTMMALSYSANALYRTDPDLYWAVMDALSEDVQRDFAANRAYWKQFEGPVGEVSTAVNNVYLKSNNQKSGVKSYGEMVDLLLAEYRYTH